MMLLDCFTCSVSELFVEDAIFLVVVNERDQNVLMPVSLVRQLRKALSTYHSGWPVASMSVIQPLVRLTLECDNMD
jgi:hypothetical protein